MQPGRGQSPPKEDQLQHKEEEESEEGQSSESSSQTSQLQSKHPKDTSSVELSPSPSGSSRAKVELSPSPSGSSRAEVELDACGRAVLHVPDAAAAVLHVPPEVRARQLSHVQQWQLSGDAILCENMPRADLVSIEAWNRNCLTRIALLAAPHTHDAHALHVRDDAGVADRQVWGPSSSWL